ncbi:hypothetical protein [Paenibacillus lautus]|uniref:hypothetical protein n=1 Tax=Paenibacillus lautus TaxID=1401 RepID=UPI003D26556C
MSNKNPKEDAEVVTSYTKEQFLQSKQFTGIDKDIIAIKLEDGKKYSVTEVKKVIETFKNKGVN